MHRLTPQDADGDKKGIGSVPDPFGTGAYTASDKALCSKAVWFTRLRCRVFVST